MNVSTVSQLPDLDYTMKFSHCLYKYVSITTPHDKRVYEGWLKTIDPVTGNSVLVTLKDDESSQVDNVIFIMRSEFEDVKVLKEVDPEMKSMLQNLYAVDKSHLAMDVVVRKQSLVNWVKKHRLPLREHEDGKSLVVMGLITIYPPFIADSCSGTNIKVLGKIRDLVEKMPIPDATGDTGEKQEGEAASD